MMTSTVSDKTPMRSLGESRDRQATSRLETPLAIRDRAIMETLYSTGLRRMELANLRTIDVSLDASTVLVRSGKGRRDRVVPLGERHLRQLVRDFVEHYHAERNHQGIGNELIEWPARQPTAGPVRRRQSVAGVLSYYYRSVA